MTSTCASARCPPRWYTTPRAPASTPTNGSRSIPPQAGTYYLMIRSTSGGGDYTLLASLVRYRVFLPVVVTGY